MIVGTEALTNHFGLDGRGFVITGASSGLGRAMAIFLAQAGASVVLVARRQAELEQLAEHIQKSGGQSAAMVNSMICSALQFFLLLRPRLMLPDKPCI
jgi:NAD(P)-dependent dehydrogenase (short-subunit alcohol dehydrogenase family)